MLFEKCLAVYINIFWVPGKVVWEAGAALWLKCSRVACQELCLEIFLPSFTSHYTSGLMAIKVMSSYQLPGLRKSVHIYMPDFNRNKTGLSALNPSRP